MLNKIKLGNKIREIRMSKGDTLEEFGIRIAHNLGIPEEKAPNKSNISRWEAGSAQPNQKRLKAIADIGQLSVNNLLYGNLNIQVSVDDYLIDKFESYLKRKNNYFKEDFKLMAPAIKSAILTFGLGFKDEQAAAIEERVKHTKNIEKLNKFGYKYIFKYYHNYTYDKFLTKYPDATPEEFKKYKENAWILFKEDLDIFWDSSELFEKNPDPIFQNHTDQLADEFNKIYKNATDDVQRGYYINEVLKPFLDNSLEEFKEYLKNHINKK